MTITYLTLKVHDINIWPISSYVATSAYVIGTNFIGIKLEEKLIQEDTQEFNEVNNEQWYLN